MSAGWVAGSVRGRLLTRRRLGTAGAREVARTGSSDAAVAALAGSSYGRDVHAGMSVGRRRAGRSGRCACGICGCWRDGCRLGPATPCGCSPAGSSWSTSATGSLRWPASRVVEPYVLGALAVAGPGWRPRRPRMRFGRRSPGRPGATQGRRSGLTRRSPWRRGGRAGWPTPYPGRRTWAAGAAALVVPGSSPPASPARRRRRRSPAATRAGVGEPQPMSRAWRRGCQPRRRWVLDGMDGPDDLWRAEGRWWRRVDDDAAASCGPRGPARRWRPRPRPASSPTRGGRRPPWRRHHGAEAGSRPSMPWREDLSTPPHGARRHRGAADPLAASAGRGGRRRRGRARTG